MAHNPLLGNRISLISKRDIRYEGTLYSINEADATVALQNVRTYGTEGREKLSNPPGTFVPPMSEIHAYLVFRGCDIKDLHVHDTPKSNQQESLPDDPAIVSSEAPPEVAAKHSSKEQAQVQDNSQSEVQEGQENNSSSREDRDEKAEQPSGESNTNSCEAESKENVDSQANGTNGTSHGHTNGVASRGSVDKGKENQQRAKNAEDRRRRAPNNGRREQQDYKGGSDGPPHAKGTGRSRRARKANEMVGTGASLLRRKERGAVEGVEGPAAGDFDFESATAGFEKEENDREDGPDPKDSACYTKDDFFDSISCDATDRRDGIDNRLRGAAERSLNTETFGAASLGSNRRGGRRHRHRGGRGRGRGRGGGRGGDSGGPHPQNRRWRRGPNYANREQNGFGSSPRATARAGGDS